VVDPNLLSMAEAALRNNRQKLMSRSDVKGVGLTVERDKPVILILVEQITPNTHQELAGSIEGVSVKVEQSGVIVSRSG